jgi:hypothetical protein
VTSQPRAFFALDLGSATTAAAVLGYLGGRWRLVAHTSGPCYVPVDSMLLGLLSQVAATDPEILAEIGAAGGSDIPSLVATWPRLEARSTPERRIAILAGSRRQRRRLETVALRAGWLVAGGSADEDDPLALSRLVMSVETGAVLLGADHSPGGDEKRYLPDLAALVAAAARCRPELTVVLAGGAAVYESAFEALLDDPSSREVATVSGGAGMAGSKADKGDPQTKMASTKAAAADEEGASEVAAAGDDGWTADPTTEEVAPDGPITDPGAAGTVPAAEARPTAAGPDGPGPAPMPLPFQAAEAHAVAAHVLLAPDAAAGEPVGASLQQVLEGLRTWPNDSRLGVAKSIASLAWVLDRPIEVIEVGLQGGLISRSEPFGPGPTTVISSHACLADGSFAPASPSEDVVDGVMAWSTTALDRHRTMDRLNDLRLVPWGEADGNGAVFRLAAAKAAFGRLVDAAPELAAHPLPELMVAAGGIFSAIPPSAVALAMADMVRRPGVSQLTIDQAHLLGPLGVIEDEDERRRLMANLADDILMQLGSLILPAGIKTGRSAGHLRLKGASSVSEIELHPGAVQVVDLPPGRAARADIDFRDAVRLGKRGRHFSVDVGGGLSGLLVDLRDIPMRISDRPDSRRATLDALQRGMWPEIDE